VGAREGLGAVVCQVSLEKAVTAVVNYCPHVLEQLSSLLSRICASPPLQQREAEKGYYVQG
jgi:hypothetical protein